MTTGGRKFPARAAALVCLMLTAGVGDPASAQASQPSTRRSNEVEGVIVTARRIKTVDGIDVRGDWCPSKPRGQASGPPRVVASFPREGEVVSPGPVTVALTFDQPMHCGWAMTYGAGREVCTQIGEWDLPGRRTWRMRCLLPPGGAWSIRFEPIKGNGFRSLAGPIAAPFALSFTTSADGSASTSPEPADPTRAARLVCPEHRLRGSGPRCRVILDETPGP